MNILFLHPHPAVDRRVRYRSAARVLQEQFGHKVVFVYVGERTEFDDGLATEHFDSWIAAHANEIEDASLFELEREYPNSNLWRSVVAQRTIADYSYLGGSFAYRPFLLDEIERFLKGVVLFYREILKKYSIDLAVAHAPDVIHSHVLYEMSLSMRFRAINQFYDPYWQRGRYMMDSVAFGSTALRAAYHQNMADYDRRIAPIESDIEELISMCGKTDPRNLPVNQVFPRTTGETIRSALRGFAATWRFFTIRPVNVWDAYYRGSFFRSLGAFGRRLLNIGVRRFVRFDKDLPTRRYVFFGLHYQPEAATLAASPVWSDMVALVRILSVSIPSGYQLVVKDHPLVGGYRAKSVYDAIRELPNVVLLPEQFPTGKVLARSDLVVTVGGTIGFQALMADVPVLMFGRNYFDCIGSILRPPDDLNDLPVYLKDLLVNGTIPDRRHRRKALLAFMEAYRSILIENPKMENPSSEEECGEGLAELIHRWACEVAPSPDASTRVANEFGMNAI